MIALIQRTDGASVAVDGKIVGKIDGGLAVFLGILEKDTEMECDFLAKKVANLRVFTDENDKMNLSLLDVGGSVLAISNFTLCANARKGNRPSYDEAMRPEEANKLYERFCEKLRENGISKVEKGVFGAEMKVLVSNDGPISVVLDTDKIMPKK
ncbi:MAG: D-tyrosyl-tRNA(Tyr) deacylase [Oscillospiraceae bacterium]|nr:D-tyrosyl-tRNA(Tyr) deacylase [Oscillospiraceae bacterium]